MGVDGSAVKVLADWLHPRVVGSGQQVAPIEVDRPAQGVTGGPVFLGSRRGGQGVLECPQVAGDGLGVESVDVAGLDEHFAGGVARGGEPGT